MGFSPQYDNSFECGTQAGHTSWVWNAAEEYISLVTGSSMDSEMGMEGSVPHPPITLESALKGNRQMRWKERSKFMEELQAEGEVCGWLTEMMLLFNPALFGELLYLVQQLWERKYLPYRHRQSTLSFLPQFSCFFGFEGAE